MLADALRGQPVSDEAEGAREKAERAFDDAKKVVMDRREAIRHRGVRGQEYRAAIEAEIPSLERVRDEKRREWLTALARAVPRPELAIGKRIDCPASEYRDHARALLADAHAGEREPLDLLAAFASDACVSRFDQIAPTPFCFVTGSGHQYFLDTVRQLMELVQPERVMRALVEPWEYDDARLSLRWDPIEDRRYALAAQDPSSEAPTTVWMANLLAYRALVLFPSAPRRAGLVTTAWSGAESDLSFTWPIWETTVGPEAIRSLLQLQELGSPAPITGLSGHGGSQWSSAPDGSRWVRVPTTS